MVEFLQLKKMHTQTSKGRSKDRKMGQGDSRASSLPHRNQFELCAIPEREPELQLCLRPGKKAHCACVQDRGRGSRKTALRSSPGVRRAKAPPPSLGSQMYWDKRAGLPTRLPLSDRRAQGLEERKKGHQSGGMEEQALSVFHKNHRQPLSPFTPRWS